MDYFKPNENFQYYLYWIYERMNIFWRKYAGEQFPYTNDSILSKHKFTNVYRTLDRTSQYLLKNVIYSSKEYIAEGMFWRIVVFKHFNLSRTWEYIVNHFGDIDEHIDFDALIRFLDVLKARNSIYSPAYMITAVPVRKKEYDIETRAKHEAYLKIFRKDIYKSGLMKDILNSCSMEELYTKMKSVSGIAEFLAFQYAVDLNYSPLFNFSENEFAAIGVGTKRGIDRTFEFKGKQYENIVFWVHQNFSSLMKEAGYGDFQPIPGRMPTVVDLLNCFCEIDKYLRGLGSKTEGVSGKRIKSKYKVDGRKIHYVFPPDWHVEL